MKPGYFILLLLLLPFAIPAAQGYKIVHPDGTVEFTDQPAKNGEEVTLPEAQGYKSAPKPVTPAQSTSATPPKQNDNVNYLLFTITSPTAEETIPNSGGVVTVTVGVSPALKPGDQVVITLDGKEVAKGGSSSFTLNEVERGAHQLGASIVGGSGQTVRQANPVTFYVFQQSILNPNNPIHRR